VEVVNHGAEVPAETVDKCLTRICGQIFKLLPLAEEKRDWKKPLETIIVELLGMGGLLGEPKMFSLVCKLEGLKSYEKTGDFITYRRTVFECCSLADEVRLLCR
jgi:hypothetical protein